jgi:HEAT repeat protein
LLVKCPVCQNRWEWSPPQRFRFLRRRRLLLSVAGVLLLGGAAGVGGWFLYERSPERTAQRLRQSSAVTELIAGLSHESPLVRKAAAERLGDLGKDADQAVPVLEPALADGEAPVRRAALHSLGKLGRESPKAVKSLVEYLKAVVRDAPDDHERHEEVLALLVSLGPSAATDLGLALKDPSDRVRSYAADGLRQLGPNAQTAVPQLLSSLQDGSGRNDVIKALGAVGPSARDAIEELLKAIKDEGLRMNAALAVLKIRPESAGKALQQLLALDGGAGNTSYDLEEFLRRLCGQPESRLGPYEPLPGAASVLASVLGSEDQHQERLSKHLIKLGRYLAGPPLHEILVHESDDPPWKEARLQAASALVEMGPEGHDLLVEAYDRGGARAQAGVIGALKTKRYSSRLPGVVEKKLDDVLVRALRHESKQIRQDAVEALGVERLVKLPQDQLPAETVPELIDNLGHPRVRRDVITALSARRGGYARELSRACATDILTKLHVWPILVLSPGERARVLKELASRDPALVPALTAALRDRTDGLRREHVALLAELGDAARGATGAVKDTTRDPDPDVRWAAALALCHLAPADAAAAVPDLIRVVGDGKEASGRRRGAAAALRRLGTQARPAAAALVQALKAPDEDLRWDAALALAAVDAVQAGPAVPLLLTSFDVGFPFARRHGAAEALGRVASVAKAGITPKLIEALESANLNQRWHAVEILTHAPGIAAAFLEDKCELVRLWSAFALGRGAVRTEAVLGALTRALKDPKVPIRMYAALALDALSADKAEVVVPILTDGLKRLVTHGEAHRECHQTLGALETELLVCRAIAALGRTGLKTEQAVLVLQRGAWAGWYPDRLARETVSRIDPREGPSAPGKAGELSEEALADAVRLASSMRAHVRREYRFGLQIFDEKAKKVSAPDRPVLWSGDVDPLMEHIGRVDQCAFDRLGMWLKHPNPVLRHTAVSLFGAMGTGAQRLAPNEVTGLNC